MKISDIKRKVKGDKAQEVEIQGPQGPQESQVENQRTSAGFVLDLEVLGAVLDNEVLFRRLETAGLRKVDWGSDAYWDVWRWIIDFEKQWGYLPRRSMVERVFGIELGGRTEGEYWVGEFLRRKAYRLVKAEVDKVLRALERSDVEAAVEELRQAGDRIKVGGVGGESIFDLGDGVIEHYEGIMRGDVGLPLPWPTLTDVTLGLWGGTATYFVARPGTGKTFIMVIIARHLWRMGKRVLLISPEMMKNEIAERFYMIETGVNVRNAVKRQLSTFEMDRFKEYVKQLEERRRVGQMEGDIRIMDSGDNLTFYGIEEAIRDFEPHIILIDSMYMLQVRGDRTERTMKVVDWVRRVSKRFMLPFVLFHQLSRNAVKDEKKGGTGYTSEAIALTDQLLWDANAVFILEQDKDMKRDNRMRIHVGKLRSGIRPNDPIDIHWDLETMNFREIGREKEYEDEDFNEFESLIGEDTDMDVDFGEVEAAGSEDEMYEVVNVVNEDDPFEGL